MIFCNPFPPQDETLLKWTAVLRGPVDTAYHTGRFRLRIGIPSNYPLSPPNVAFVTKIFHPNVHWKVRVPRMDSL